VTRRRLASVEEHPKGSGRFRVRVRAGGATQTLASGVSRPRAEEIADAYAVECDPDISDELTLQQFGVGFLERRERCGVRGIATDRSYWRKHVAKATLGARRLSTIRRRDVRQWVAALALGWRSQKKALSLVTVALQEALDLELIDSNPARDVRVHRSGDRSALDELAGILTPAEQTALLAAVPRSRRSLVTFALVTGMRQAEQWWLRHEDIGHGYLVVRRSVGGKPPKSGQARTVHLLGPAVRALQLAPVDSEWVWPALRGGRRQQGKAPKGWHGWVRKAGIARRIRWHDLRHTCATALLAGWWGRKWTIDEVCQHLGHSSVTVTERYARKLAETNRLAVEGTVFPAESPLMLPTIAIPAGIKGADSGIRTRDLRFTKAPGSDVASRAYLSSGSQLGLSHVPAAWVLAYAANDVLRRAG